MAYPDDIIKTMQATIDRLTAEIEQLKRLVQEAQRGQKRQAAPFSKGEPKPDPKTPGRKPGENYGAKAHRQPPEKFDEIHEARHPEVCDCGGCVEFVQTVEQCQTEIPRQPIHRKFVIHCGRCKNCGKPVQGRHPLQTSGAIGAAGSQIGPDAQALIVTLNKEKGLSYGKIENVMDSAFGISVSRGACAQIVLRAAEKCAPQHEEIKVAVKQSKLCVPDETGWRVGGKRHWMHVFVTLVATLYMIRKNRDFNVAAEALGADYDGVLPRDGWKTYDKFEHAKHQQCLAHLLRHCEHLLETAKGGAVRFPRQIKELLLEGLTVRDRRDAGEITQAEAEHLGWNLDLHLIELCVNPKMHDGNRRLSKFLIERWDQVFQFLRLGKGECDATNWRAEQAIRPAVVNRKVWGGNRTDNGAKAQEVLLSVLRTAMQQGKQTLDFLAEILCAPLGLSPKLLPAPG